MADDKPILSAAYEVNESDVKDKLPELCAALKSGNGVPKDIAAWMLLHHASVSASSAADIVGSGGAVTCLGVMQDATVPPQSRSSLATLFRELAKPPELRETLLRLRQGGRPCAQILLGLVSNARVDLPVRLNAADALAMLTSDKDLADVAWAAFPGGALSWQALGTLLSDVREAPRLRGHIAHFLFNMLAAKEDMLAAAAAAGVAARALELGRAMKRDRHLQHAFGLLSLLLSDRSLWPDLLAQGGLRVLVDMLGPPPVGVACHEFRTHQLWRRHPSGAEPGALVSRKRQAQSVKSAPKTQRAVVHSTQAAAPRNKIEASLLSFSAVAIPFKYCVSLQTKVFVAQSLQQLVQDAAIMKQLVAACIAPRLCTMLLEAVATAADDGGKGKKKGVALDAVQIAAVRAATGILKFVAVLPKCAVLVAHSGALKVAVSLLGHPSLSIRRNCHIVVGHCALLRENTDLLSAANVPEEYLLEKPMQMPEKDQQEMAAEREGQQLEGKFPTLDSELQIHGHLLHVLEPPAALLASMEMDTREE